MTERTLLNKAMIRLLAGTIVLTCKTRFSLWSIKTESLATAILRQDHAMLDVLCNDLAVRIGVNGGSLPGTYPEFFPLSSIGSDLPDSITDKLAALAIDHERLVCDSQFVTVLAEKRPDVESEDLLMRSIEQNAHAAERLKQLLPRDGDTRN